MDYDLTIRFAADSLQDADTFAEGVSDYAEAPIIALTNAATVEDTPLSACERERIALADAFRSALEAAGMHATTAALVVQDVIDRARLQP